MKITWISPLPLTPVTNGARAFQASLAERLVNAGHELFFIYCGPQMDPDSVRKMKQMVTRFLYVPAYAPDSPAGLDLRRLEVAVRLFADQIDYLICSYIIMNRLFAIAPAGTVKISIPFLRKTGPVQDFFFYKQQEFLRMEKRPQFSGVDLAIARNSPEEREFRKADPDVQVLTCPDQAAGEEKFKNFCSTLERRKKRVLIILDYPFWMVRFGGHAPSILVMVQYLRKRYSLEVYYTGELDDDTIALIDKMGLGDLVRIGGNYRDDCWHVEEPDEHDFLPGPMTSHYQHDRYKAFAKFIASQPAYDAVLVFTVFNSYYIKAIPYKTLTILDTHDFWSTRNYIYKGSESTLLSASQEIGIFRRFDSTLMIEESETDHARHLMPEKVSICCPFTFPAEPLAFPKTGIHFGFIAPGHIYEPIKWFIDEVWAFQDRPDARLHLFGTVCERFAEAPPNVILHGIVQSEKTIHKYCNVMLNPAFVATGISTKTVMALAYGRPVLATSVGARGVTRKTGRGVYVADSRAEFIRGMQLFSHDRGFLQKFSQDALQFSREEFTLDRAYEPLAQLIESY